MNVILPSRSVVKTASPMLVTHLPFVGELAALLTGRRAPLGFATSEIAVLEKDGAGFRLGSVVRLGRGHRVRTLLDLRQRDCFVNQHDRNFLANGV